MFRYKKRFIVARDVFFRHSVSVACGPSRTQSASLATIEMRHSIRGRVDRRIGKLKRIRPWEQLEDAFKACRMEEYTS